MSIGETSNKDDVDASNLEKIDLVPCLRATTISDIASNISPRNETKNLLREERVEHGTTLHNNNRRKVKIK